MTNKPINIKKSKFSLSSIIRNNRVLMLLSLIISFGLWVWVSVEKSPITQKVITDVPVNIELSGSIPEQLKLQIFGDNNFKVDVTVSGKKYILASIDKDDIVVSAITNYVDSSGSKTLQLKYAVADGSEDFDIISLSSSYIEVYFDTFKQVELPLQANFTEDINSLLPESCVLGDIVFSKQTITVSGPASEINRISKAVANVTLSEKLEKNTTLIPDVQLITEDGSKLVYSQIDNESKDITMSIPIFKTVTLPTSVTFKNAPANFVSDPLKYTVSPSQITAAIPIDLVETTKSIPVAVIDFADITNGINVFNISSSDISDIMATSATASKFRVTVDASSMSSKTVTIPASKVRIKNSDDLYSVRNIDTRNLTFTVIGEKEVLDSITADDITLNADLQSTAIDENVNSLPVIAAVSSGKCWVNGRNDVNVSVSEK